MNILITGASGLIGRALSAHLRKRGHQVFAMQRSDDVDAPFHWSPSAAHDWQIRWDESQAIDAVIHLAGEPISGTRWTAAKKQRIRDSRIDTTNALVNQFKTLKTPPAVFLSASAIGFYGNCGEQVVDERQPVGDDFLAHLARDWESAANRAGEQAIRVVNLRTGLVLAKAGGMLKSLAPAFKLGMGGKVGNGRQWMSWVELSEIVKMMTFLLENPDAHGAFNLVSPNAVTNADFTQALAGAVRRPACVPLPTFAVKTAFGEMGELLLLSSAHVKPRRLRELGFALDERNLLETLKALDL